MHMYKQLITACGFVAFYDNHVNQYRLRLPGPPDQLASGSV